MSHPQIHTTRREFIEQFGLTPPANVLGMTFHSPKNMQIVREYIFDDEIESVIGQQKEVAELWRMFNL